MAQALSSSRSQSSRLLYSAEKSLCTRCLYRSAPATKVFRGLRWNSTAAGPTPLLVKIKEELKAAMRAKDTARLNVLRGTISEINQAASSSSPIKTDAQILSLLRKRKSSSEQAIKEAQEAQRPDLVEKQEKEIVVVDELTSSVKMMDPLEMRQVVRRTVEALRGATPGDLKPGAVMKELLKPGGELEGKMLENKVLAELVREEVMSDHS